MLGALPFPPNKVCSQELLQLVSFVIVSPPSNSVEVFLGNVEKLIIGLVEIRNLQFHVRLGNDGRKLLLDP